MFNSLSKKVYYLFILSFLLLNNVFACACPPTKNVADSISSSELIFQGVVQNIEEPTISSSISDKNVVSMSLSRIWKGSNVSKNYDVYTSVNDISCGYNFEKGKEYLVYANSINNTYDVSMCSRTKLTSNAKDDLEKLGTPIKDLSKENNMSLLNIIFYIIVFLVIFNFFVYLGYFLYKYSKKNGNSKQI